MKTAPEIHASNWIDGKSLSLYMDAHQGLLNDNASLHAYIISDDEGVFSYDAVADHERRADRMDALRQGAQGYGC